MWEGYVCVCVRAAESKLWGKGLRPDGQERFPGSVFQFCFEVCVSINQEFGEGGYTFQREQLEGQKTVCSLGRSVAYRERVVCKAKKGLVYQRQIWKLTPESDNWTMTDF